MANELWNTLMRFHREIALPDVERLLDTRIGRVDERIDALADQMLTHFDAIYVRFERLESEYHSVRAAVGRLEQR